MIVRISAFENDAGYVPDFWSYRVFLNDQPLSGCFAADEKTGVAWVHRDSAPGERLYGDVRVVRVGGNRLIPIDGKDGRRIQASWQARWASGLAGAI